MPASEVPALDSRETVYTSHFLTAELRRYGDARVLSLVRSAERSASLEEVAHELRRFLDHVDTLDRASTRFLFDLRAVMGRNDAGFEALMDRYRARLMGGYRRMAILVRTEVGRLHVERRLRNTGITAKVFREESEALRWLLTAAP